MGDAEDFWPAIDDAEAPNSPVVLLRKQAQILADKTGHRLVGRVSTATMPPGGNLRAALGLEIFDPAFTHVFAIDVPSLDDYRYTLFAVTHGIEPYPVGYEDEARNSYVLIDVRAFT